MPTWQIAVGRWLGGTHRGRRRLAVAFALAAVVAGASGGRPATVAIAGAFGAQAYVAVFLAIGCMTKRAAVWSLAFVFLVERLLGAALAGIAQLSPSWEARAAFVGLTDAREDFVREGIPHGNAALVRLGLITVDRPRPRQPPPPPASSSPAAPTRPRRKVKIKVAATATAAICGRELCFRHSRPHVPAVRPETSSLWS